MAKASDGVFGYSGSERRYRLTTVRIPPHHKHCHKVSTNNLAVRTVPVYPTNILWTNWNSYLSCVKREKKPTRCNN